MTRPHRHALKLQVLSFHLFIISVDLSVFVQLSTWQILTAEPHQNELLLSSLFLGSEFLQQIITAASQLPLEN